MPQERIIQEQEIVLVHHVQRVIIVQEEQIKQHVQLENIDHQLEEHPFHHVAHVPQENIVQEEHQVVLHVQVDIQALQEQQLKVVVI